MQPPDASAASSSSLEDLLVACLRCAEDEGEPAVERLLAAHPSQSDVVRQHLARLGALGSPSDALPDVGPYRPLRVLGRGGMGEVVLAEQKEPVRRLVAIKRIRREAWTKELKARFEFERQALAILGHDGIARMFDAGTTAGGDPYFVMEYVDGLPISLYCDQHALPVEARLELLLQACAALSHAHQHGVLHRDLKPSNLLVHGDPGSPHVKVIDFGLAKGLGADTPAADLTLTGQILGTPEYMSPEQATGSQSGVDTRTDVYALGAILFELLTGTTPHADKREQGVLALLREIQDGVIEAPSARVRGLPPPDGREAARRRGCDSAERLALELRGDLDWIVLKALSKDREQRYAGVAELGADLRRLLAHEPVLAGPTSAIYRLRKFVRRNRTATLSAAVIVAVLLVASPIVAFSLGKATRVQARFDVLKDVSLLRELKSRAKNELWPVIPDKIRDLEGWLRVARELAARLPEYERDLPRPLPAGTEEDQLGYEERIVRTAHRQLVEELKEFAAPKEGLFTLGATGIASVDKRLEWARRMRQVTLEEPARLWQEAIASIADAAGTPLYEGLRIRPQLGLVPLRKDPRSGLWEFRVVTPDGEPPALGRGGRFLLQHETDLILVLIPGGEVEYEYGLGTLKETAKVRLEPFFLGKHEVSQGQWQRLTGETPSMHRMPDEAIRLLDPQTHPVEGVTWEQAKTGLSLFGLSLPTEAQWVHAARGNTAPPHWPRLEGMSPDGCVNVADRSAVRAKATGKADFEGRPADFDDGFPVTAPVDTLLANPFGLHHVLGNVWEYCLDAAAANSDRQPTSTRARDGYREYSDVKEHVVRGGSCRGPLERAKPDSRLLVPRDSSNPVFGFRPARALDR